MKQGKDQHICVVIIMAAANHLALQGAMASAAMVLTKAMVT